MENEMPTSVGWSGPPELARRGCSLGNADYFVRADAEANVDGLWLAANNRWYLGELSLRLIRSEARCIQSVYGPQCQAMRYQDESGAVWERCLQLDPTGQYITLFLSGGGFSPDLPI